MADGATPLRHWYDGGMPRFGLKDLFISITLIALGSAVFVIPLHFRAWTKDNPLASLILIATLPGALLGAGIGRLFQRAWLGIRVGLVVWLLVGFAFALLFPETNDFLFPARYYFQQ